MVSPKLPMTSDLPLDAAAVLELERKARHQGTGLTLQHLDGCWWLKTTWSRQGAPAPKAASLLLRALQACLELQMHEFGLRIANQVSLGPLRLRFEGSANLLGPRPLLQFSFSSVQVKLGSTRLLERTLPQPKPQRMPFFALIGMGEDSSWLCARGRGGGLALWVKDLAVQR